MTELEGMEDVMTPATKLRKQTSATTAAEQVVARLDTYSQAEHVDAIKQARERGEDRRLARRLRAEAAAERLRNAS
ncbi:hypothetical protein GCM10009845_35220 [Pedococcus bigeumensis]